MKTKINHLLAPPAVARAWRIATPKRLMRKSILILATIAVLAAAANAADEFVADELLVGFQPGIRGAQADGIRNALRATKRKAWPEIRAEHWSLPPGLGVAQAIQALSAQ